jgi:hypothetical protein
MEWTRVPEAPKRKKHKCGFVHRCPPVEGVKIELYRSYAVENALQTFDFVMLFRTAGV